MPKMWSAPIEDRANQILEQLKQDRRLGRYVDGSFQIPQPFRGTRDIRLIVLGQDPTIKDAEKRQDIKTVLNLDKNGSVRAYLAGVCKGLGISIENLYATNFYKNFFVSPPTQIEEVDIFQEFAGTWLPLLIDELAEFARVPVITLGEPLLAPLVENDIPAQVRYYWGYVPEWKTRRHNPFQSIRAEDNKLGRVVFPFPHQPSLRKEFYKAKMKDYVAFVKKNVLT